MEIARDNVIPFEGKNDALIREAAALDAEIKGKSERLKELKLKLAALAEFKPGSMTGHLVGGGHKVKVQVKEYVKWDQDKLDQVRSFNPAKFNEIFKPEYKPISKKTLDGFLEHGNKNMADGVRWAMTVTPGAPQVTFESLGD